MGLTKQDADRARADGDAATADAIERHLDALAEAECLDGPDGCEGEVEFRLALSATGQSFPRCAKHWAARLEREDEHRQRDADARHVDYLDAGERWEDD